MQKGTTSYLRSHNEKMNFFDLIATRHSVRAYEDKKLQDDMVDKILSAANKAPSAKNLQSYRIFVVQKKEDKKKLVTATHDQDFIEDASIVLIFCADLISAKEAGVRGLELYCIQDATIACTYSQLAVHALGLSSVWVGSFDEEMVRRLFSIDRNFKPVSMLVVGFPDEEPEKRSRKSLNEISQRI
ncbi:MAG: nitroreductase family protein [Thaumarchaeota archaeon]|nr:nitroreductase family protein [Nitrososphaerota archaeon]